MALKIQTNKYREFKTKFIYYIDEFFKGNDPSKDIDNFWDEFFLYNVNITYISDKFKKLSTESLLQLKGIFEIILQNSIVILKNTVKNKKKQEENDIHDSQTNVSKIRQSNALDMIYSIFNGVLDPQRNNNIITELFMKKENNQMMIKLVESLKLILLSDVHEVIKAKILRIMIILTTGNDDIVIVHNFFINQFLDSETYTILAKFITETKNEISIIQAFVLISVLANYNKYDSKNTFLISISDQRDHKFTSKFIKILSNICVRNKSLYNLVMNNSSSYKTLFRYMFTFNKNPSDDGLNINKCYDLLQKSIFLLFYDMVYNNDYFVKILFSPRIEEYPDAPINSRLIIIPEESPLMQASSVNECLENFLSLSSFLFCKIEDEDDILYVNSIFLIIICLCENSTSLSNITNPKHLRNIEIFKMKHGTSENPKNIAGYILDLMALFISNNLGKKELLECYYQALLIIQKIVFYLTQMEIRFVYQWNELFNSLFLMINYISTKISEYKNEILIKNIINMLFKTISFLLINGKIFMDNMNDYDNLIKTIIDNKEGCLKIKTIKINLEGLSSNENLDELHDYFEDNVLQFFKPINEVIEAATDFSSKLSLNNQIKNYTDNIEFKTIIESIDNYYENPYKRNFFTKFNKLVASYLKNMVMKDTSLDDFIPSLTTSANKII